jgi:hypothetical protein
MKLYLAGLYSANFNLTGRVFAGLTDQEKAHRAAVKYILESYHYVNKPSFVKKIRQDGVKVFLDSGAFSAFSKGVSVDMKKFCRYIHEHEDIIEVVSVLDSIGDAQGTYENQGAMERLGTSPLPCFHYNEDPRYLEYYVANYDYVTLGGMVPISTPQLIKWLDTLWEKYLTDGAGRPKVKIHGFGLTTISLVLRYPWYSVDSSTWAQAAAHGQIFHPDYGAIQVSERSPARKHLDRHIDTMSPPIQEALIKKLCEPGFDFDRIRKLYQSRWAYNCWSFPELGERGRQDVPTFLNEQLELF